MDSLQLTDAKRIVVDGAQLTDAERIVVDGAQPTDDGCVVVGRSGQPWWSGAGGQLMTGLPISHW